MLVETISSRTMEQGKEMDIFNCSFTQKEKVLILSVNEWALQCSKQNLIVSPFFVVFFFQFNSWPSKIPNGPLRMMEGANDGPQKFWPGYNTAEAISRSHMGNTERFPPTEDVDDDFRIRIVYWWNADHSPGPVIRELVPSSHQRSELSNTILCIFSGWDQRIGEGIPIPDSLGEEATFINIRTGNGSLKWHRVLIPITPSFGDKVICWYTGFTFKTFI